MTGERGMGEHMLHAKQMKSRRNGIFRKRTNGIVHNQN